MAKSDEMCANSSGPAKETVSGGAPQQQHRPVPQLPCTVNRTQFVQRLMRWPWLLSTFETLGSQNHLGFDTSFLRRVLSAMFDELIRVYGSTEDAAPVSAPVHAHAHARARCQPRSSRRSDETPIVSLRTQRSQPLTTP